MSQYPPPGPPYYGPPPPWPYPPPPHHHPHHSHHPPHHPHDPHHHPQYPPPPDFGQVTAPPPPDYGQVTAPQPVPYPYFVPGTMMIPVPVPGQPAPPADSNQTYITNYIYHGESSNGTADQVQIAETSGDYEWIPTTATLATSLSGRAVIGGHEGWDGSPLWVIRAWHGGDLIPGKLSVRHNAASIMSDGKEIPVQNIEVLCSQPESLRWVPASNGNVPPGAISGGTTASGETLYVGRARHQLSVTPGKVHPSHNSCYIGFAGSEVTHKMYDVLCRVS